MRTLSWLVLIPSVALAAGAIGSGCGGSAPAAAGPGSGAPESEHTIGPSWPYMDAGCPAPPSANVATFDAESAGWACTQTVCAAELSSCGADCECNNEILTALACARLDGGVDECFSTAFAAMAGATWSRLSNCLALGGAECLLTDGGVAAACDDGGNDGGDGGDRGCFERLSF